MAKHYHIFFRSGISWSGGGNKSASSQAYNHKCDLQKSEYGLKPYPDEQAAEDEARIVSKIPNEEDMDAGYHIEERSDDNCEICTTDRK